MPRSVKFCRAEMMTLPDWHHQPVVEELLSHRLVAVERLSWEPVGNSGRREVGPVRMVFDNGYGLALSGSTTWTLDMWVTSPGDDSWLNTYDDDLGDGRWVLRDAGAEDPFADAMGATLTDWQAVHNEALEIVGLRLSFDGREMPLIVREGEVTT